MAHRVKWLMVFLVQNVFDVEEDTIFMNMTLGELLELKADRSIAVVGCISTSVLPTPMVLELDSAIEGKGKVFNFVVELRIGAPKKEKRLHVLDQVHGSGLDNPGTVTNIFRTIRKHFEYEHVLLTTLDHGSGYSIFAEPGPGSPSNNNLSAASKASRLLKHPFPALAHESRTRKGSSSHSRKKAGGRSIHHIRALVSQSIATAAPSGITIDQLRKAIHSTFGKVDVIFMRNCFMQMFDTGCTLFDVTRYLVAFESLMWFPAYNYSIWLRAMQAKGGKLTPEEVATQAIHGFKAARMLKKFRNDSAVFGNDLSFFPCINDVMNRMIRELIDFMHGHRGELLQCRAGMPDIASRFNPNADYQLVDARMWFTRAGHLLAGNKTYQEALQGFLALQEQSIGTRRVVGKWVKSESGFSLYFPNNRTDVGVNGSFYALYYAAKSPSLSLFNRYSLWPEFISYLFLNIKPNLKKVKLRPMKR